MRYGGPLYVAVAVVLILAVGCVFFASVLPLVRLSGRTPCHLSHNLTSGMDGVPCGIKRASQRTSRGWRTPKCYVECGRGLALMSTWYGLMCSRLTVSEDHSIRKMCCVQVLDAEGTWRAAGHGATGAVLLGNVLLNYWLCVTTSPGYVTDLTAAVSRLKIHQCTSHCSSHRVS